MTKLRVTIFCETFANVYLSHGSAVPLLTDQFVFPSSPSNEIIENEVLLTGKGPWTISGNCASGDVAAPFHGFGAIVKQGPNIISMTNPDGSMNKMQIIRSDKNTAMPEEWYLPEHTATHIIREMAAPSDCDKAKKSKWPSVDWAGRFSGADPLWFEGCMWNPSK